MLEPSSHATVDLFRFHDLTARLAAYSTDGGTYLRGDAEDVRIEDAEPILAPGEAEVARFAGALQLIGPRSVPSTTDAPSFGLVLEGGGVVVMTTTRLIVMAAKGESQLGTITAAEVHTFALPWDLVDSISIPARKTMSDRIAGGRTIDLFSSLMVSLTLSPVKHAEVGGAVRRITDDEVMNWLVRTAVEHRLAVSPTDDHERLHRLTTAPLPVEDGDRTAWISPEDTDDLPPHLKGRVVERDAA